MDDSFEIPVEYKGREYSFSAKLLKLGYIYRFLVDVNRTEVYFEQDDEGNYRALVDPSNLDEGVKINKGLLEAIAISLKEILE